MTQVTDNYTHYTARDCHVGKIISYIIGGVRGKSVGGKPSLYCSKEGLTVRSQIMKHNEMAYIMAVGPPGAAWNSMQLDSLQASSYWG